MVNGSRRFRVSMALVLKLPSRRPKRQPWRNEPTRVHVLVGSYRSDHLGSAWVLRKNNIACKLHDIAPVGPGQTEPARTSCAVIKQRSGKRRTPRRRCTCTCTRGGTRLSPPVQRQASRLPISILMVVIMTMAMNGINLNDTQICTLRTVSVEEYHDIDTINYI